MVMNGLLGAICTSRRIWSSLVERLLAEYAGPSAERLGAVHGVVASSRCVVGGEVGDSDCGWQVELDPSRCFQAQRPRRHPNQGTSDRSSLRNGMRLEIVPKTANVAASGSMLPMLNVTELVGRRQELPFARQVATAAAGRSGRGASLPSGARDCEVGRSRREQTPSGEVLADKRQWRAATDNIGIPGESVQATVRLVPERWRSLGRVAEK